MSWRIRLDDVKVRQAQCVIEATVQETESGRAYPYRAVYTDPADITIPKLRADAQVFVQDIETAADAVASLKEKIGQVFDL